MLFYSVQYAYAYSLTTYRELMELHFLQEQGVIVNHIFKETVTHGI